MLFMKILEPIWAIEVADGQKMFECVANKTKWQNQFKQLSSGDLFIVVMKGRDKVNAVCEVASPAIVKETNRDVLKSKLQESRHAALDAAHIMPGGRRRWQTACKVNHVLIINTSRGF